MSARLNQCNTEINTDIFQNSIVKEDLTIGKVVSKAAAPTTGTYVVGDVVFNSDQVAGEAAGWVCTVAGTPGTWVAFGTDLSNMMIINETIASLAAGADLDGSAKGIFVVPAGYVFNVVAVNLISRGTAAGIDDSNTSAISVKNGSDVVATKTFNTTVTFPADLAGVALTNSSTAANLVIAAGGVLKVVVLNGTTADLPEFIVQVIGQLETV